MSIGVVAGLLGSGGALALATGVAPVPTALHLASNDSPRDAAEVKVAGSDHRLVSLDESTTTTTSTTDTTMATTTTTVRDANEDRRDGRVVTAAPASPTTRTLSAADAGTVTYTVDGTTLRLVSADPASGWTADIEQAAGREIEVDFRNATERVKVNIEFEDGQVRERVRPQTESANSGPGSQSSTSSGDDHSGSGRGGSGSSGGNHSGSGRGGHDDGPAHT